ACPIKKKNKFITTPPLSVPKKKKLQIIEIGDFSSTAKVFFFLKKVKKLFYVVICLQDRDKAKFDLKKGIEKKGKIKKELEKKEKKGQLEKRKIKKMKKI
ncbi:hypothetical protein RFI_15757, partial [Reticulomyxa filosa]